MQRVREILGVEHVVVASAHEDLKEATDLKVLAHDAIRVGVRIRERKFFEHDEWRHDITFRFRLPSGARTEFAKIFEDGCLDRYFYGFADGDDLLGFAILDVAGIRSAVAADPSLVSSPRTNFDGTQFVAIDTRKLPAKCRLRTWRQPDARGAGWIMYRGDCIDVMRQLPDRSVAHVITDPPYSARVHDRLGQESRADGSVSRAALDFSCLTREWSVMLAEQFDSLASRWEIAFGDEYTMGYWIDCGLEWVRPGWWVKPDAMPQLSGDGPGVPGEHVAIMHTARIKGSGRKRWNGGGRPARWTHNITRDSARSGNERAGNDHPTPKPIALMLDLVDDFTDVGETILDPFAGSGTTGVACLRRGRKFIGVEKDPKYFALAVERLRAEEGGLTLQAARAGQLALIK